MKNWFLSLSERDKKIVTGLGIFVGLLLIYTFLWMPLQKDNAQLEKRIERSQSDLQWMQQAAIKIQALGPVSWVEKTRNPSSGSFLTVIEKTASSANIKLKKIVPKNGGQVEIRLIDVSFNKAIGWIAVLKSQHGILVSKLSAEKTGSGKVNLTMLLAG